MIKKKLLLIKMNKAENKKNILKTYYPNLIRGKNKSWIDVYVMNQTWTIQEGKPVYPDFVSETHLADEEIPVAMEYLCILVLTLVLLLLLYLVRRFEVDGWYKSEIVAIDMGVVRFAELLRQEIATRFLVLMFIYMVIQLVTSERKQMNQLLFKYCEVLD